MSRLKSNFVVKTSPNVEMLQKYRKLLYIN